MHARQRRLAAAATLTAASVVAALTLTSPAAVAHEDKNASKKLQQKVTLDGLTRHMDAFQEIADANGGNRASGTQGYAESVEYVSGQLRGAGYDVQTQTFPFAFFQELSPAEFEQTAPTARTYEVGVDFATMSYSGSGDFTAPITEVDLQIPPPTLPGSTSGCEAADFAGFPAGNIALIQRGTCTFFDKATNAAAAGASAVVIFNEGQAGRTDVLTGTLGEPVAIPVIGTTFAIGAELAATDGVALRVRTDTISEERETFNVLAETKDGDDDNVVMVGAHLDSVLAGPGINDNGTGSAGILEVALQMKEMETENQVRFAWWGAEESGLLGAEHYVSNLTPRQLGDIALYLNFDMIGSPNYMRGVYDGNNTLGADPATIPAGSGAIEKLFNRHFKSKGLPFQDTEFSGRSDYGPFIAAGVPAGGLFTGAEELKTEAEVALYGGVAGEPYDPCYHEVCDSLSPVADGATDATYTVNADELYGNVNTVALDTNADAIAHAVATYAEDTSPVNGNGDDDDDDDDKGKGKGKGEDDDKDKDDDKDDH